MEESSRIFCVGRNYVAHAKELGNVVPKEPVIFIKPISCLVKPGGTIRYPSHGNDLQHEVEVAVKIGSDDQIINGITLGLDLTLRDIQTQLKQKGLPWELAKAFDDSAPMGEWQNYDGQLDLENIDFFCYVNDELRQEGNTKDMLFPILEIVNYLKSIWRLNPGDIILTGTPPGVFSLCHGDKITIKSQLLGSYTWQIS